ncbi:MAG: hypothetical protein IKR40_08975 [Treponema sp.]|nr:hypothetical protein [Treponema sp.]
MYGNDKNAVFLLVQDLKDGRLEIYSIVSLPDLIRQSLLVGIPASERGNDIVS